MSKIKVLVVDDSFFMRKVIVDILNSDPDTAVVGQAADGVEALKLIDELHPDVITLDLVMPNLNGFGTLEQIVVKDRPPAVLMVSAYTQEDTEVTLNCLSMGAVDFVLKPSESSAHELSAVKLELLAKVKIAAATSFKRRHTPVGADAATHPPKPRRVVVIGSSTGGPVALEQLLPRLPKNLPYPVLVAQHLPAQFVASLVSRLGKACALEVQIAGEGNEIRPGTIYFAPGGTDTEVVKAASGPAKFKISPTSNTLSPSVTKLLASAARAYGAGTLGVILTGMGDDGLEGMRTIKAAGGTTLVQDEASSIVFGMGRAVVENELADEILPLDQIAGKLQ